MTKKNRKILFICTANAIRSQIAEALVNNSKNGLSAQSAGIRPTHKIDKYTIDVLNEIGVEHSDHSVKSVEDYKDTHFDIVITLGSTAYQDCPRWLYEKSITDHWGFTDVSGKSKRSFRRLRDNMKSVIDKFLMEYSNDMSEDEVKGLLRKHRM